MQKTKLQELIPVMDCLQQPVFAMQANELIYGNPSFQELGIRLGMPMERFCGSYVRIPETNDSHPDEMTCVIGGKQFVAAVRRLEDAMLYLLTPVKYDMPTQLLAHCVSSIRISLHGMYSAAAALCEKVEQLQDEQSQKESAAVLQGIFRLERTAGNLDMLQRLESGTQRIRFVNDDIINFLDGIFSKAASMLSLANKKLVVEYPNKLFRGNLDKELTELALWNLLSNAARFSSGSTIHVTVRHRRTLMQIDFVNEIAGEMILETQNLFRRFEAPIEQRSAAQGSGLGIALSREIALQHGGNLMLSTQGDTVCVSMTLGLTNPEQPEMHFALPVAASLDTGLVGLSNVLPASAYDSRDIV